MSKPRDIKKGLQGLQLNQAMKLKGGSLSLTPPVANATGVSNTSTDATLSRDLNATRDTKLSEDTIATSVTAVSQVHELSPDLRSSRDAKITEDETASRDGFRTEDKKSTQVQNYALDRNSPQDRKSSLDSTQSQDSQASRDVARSTVRIETVDTFQTSDGNEPRIKRGEGSRKATEQDSAVVFEKRERAGLRAGFTRISNEMLLDILEGDLSKSEIKILLLISRFTTSFQKEFAPLSKTVVERYTRLQGKSVLDAMSGLEDKQMIQKRRGDERSPNQLGLAKKYAVGDARNTQGKNSSSDVLKPKEDFCAEDNFAPPFKDNNKYLNKYSLSQNSESLRKYFENLKPKAKRDEEFRIFGELKSDFSEEQIQLCLEYLQKHGSLKAGEPCHSPMAYLGKAIGQVLPLALGALEKAQVNARREAAYQREQELKRQEDAESERLAQEADRKFAECFSSPEDQERKINEIIRGHFATSVLPQRLLKRIAIQRWFELESNKGGSAHA